MHNRNLKSEERDRDKDVDKDWEGKEGNKERFEKF